MKTYQEKELLKLSRTDLYAIARDRQIPRRSALTKQELIEAILAGQTSVKTDGSPEKPAKAKPSETITPATPAAAPKSPPRKARRPAPMEEVFTLPEEAVQAEAVPEHLVRSEEGRIQGHELSGDLPLGYGDNRIVLQARDPFWAHTYWEMSHQVRDRLRQTLGGERYQHSRFILRVYDITGLTFTGDNANTYFDVAVFEGAGNWYLHLNRPDRSFLVDLGLITPEGQFYLIARSNAIHTPRGQASATIDSEWEISDEEYQRMYTLSGGGQMGASSGELMESLSRRLELDLSSGSVSSLSSPCRRPEEAPGKPFRLKVRTELIVYGSTEPDARLTVQGRPVPLRPDGTFTLRFALPDGEQVIPVHAVNKDGDMERTITPRVEKTTS